MGLLYMAEGTAPSTPSSGQGVLYIKSADSLLYYKSDGGTEYLLSLLVGGVVPPSKGGTGIGNNDASTLTISGAFATTLTVTGSTALTLPTSGTVTALGNTTTGSGSTIVLGTSPTFTTSVIGGATMAVFNSASTTVNAFGAATTLNIGNAGGTNTVLGATTFSQALTASSTIAAGGTVTLTNASNAAVFSAVASTAAKAAYASYTANGFVSYVGMEGTTTTFGGNAADMVLFNGGLAMRIPSSATPSVFFTNGMNGVLGATTPAALSATTGAFSQQVTTSATSGAFSGAGLILKDNVGSATGYLLANGGVLYIGNASGATNFLEVNSNGIAVTGSVSIGTGSGTSAGLIAGYFGASGYGAIWSTGVTPSTTNFSFLTNGTSSTVLNSPGSVVLQVANTDRVVVNASGMNGVLGATTPAAASVTTLGASGLITGNTEIDLNRAGASGAIGFRRSGTYEAYIKGVSGGGLEIQTGSGLTAVTAVSAAGAWTFPSSLTALGGATFFTTSTALTDGAGAGAGTILNAPAAGNPTKWIGINDNGTTRYIPAW